MTGRDINRRLQFQIIFAFLVIYAIVLFATRPDPTSFQIIFRAAVAVIGLVGFLLVSRRK